MLKANGRIDASIEVSPRQAVESEDLPGLFPAGVRVYITDIGNDSTERLVAAAKRVTGLGYRAVPHIAARRLGTRADFADRIQATCEEAGATDALVIGGGLESPAGDFASTLDVLETGLLDKFGVTHIGVAGHPEGSPDFDEDSAWEALRLKKAFAERTGAQMRIVTQFGFDGARFAAWTDTVREHGIDLPIHLGVSGPAKISTLVKYAAMCGVGNSLSFFKKNHRSIASLASRHSPDSIVEPIEQHVRDNAESAIAQIHVFPFGGIKNSANWLRTRGSWDPQDADQSASVA